MSMYLVYFLTWSSVSTSAIRVSVSARHVSAGEYVTPGTRLYDLVATDRVKFVFSVAERDVTGILPGQKMTVLF